MAWLGGWAGGVLPTQLAARGGPQDSEAGPGSHNVAGVGGREGRAPRGVPGVRRRGGSCTHPAGPVSPTLWAFPGAGPLGMPPLGQ